MSHTLDCCTINYSHSAKCGDLIVYCPLHAAAPALLEACIKMVARFEELSQDRSICVAPELCIMADAIHHAEGKG